MSEKRKKLTLVPVALLIGGSLFAVGHTLRAKSLSAQQVFVPSSEDRPVSPRDALVHVGFVVSMNGSPLVLRDDDNNTWYNLDDQDRVNRFSGMKVVVTGKLIKATDTIHVEAIDPARM